MHETPADAAEVADFDVPQVDEWLTHAAWALELVRGLAEKEEGRPAKQRLVEALAERFDAAAVVTVTVPEGGALAGTERFSASPPSTAAGLVVTSSFDHSIRSQDGTVTAITLERSAASREFSATEKRWIELVCHACLAVGADDAFPMAAARRLAHLSPRERETLAHLVAGASEKEVAALLGRSRHTVHSYVKRIYRTLGIRSRSQLRTLFREARRDGRDDEKTAPVTAPRA